MAALMGTLSEAEERELVSNWVEIRVLRRDNLAVPSIKRENLVRLLSREAQREAGTLRLTFLRDSSVHLRG